MGTFIVKKPGANMSFKNGNEDDLRKIIFNEGGCCHLDHLYLHRNDALEDANNGTVFMIQIHDDMLIDDTFEFNFRTDLPQMPNIYGTVCFVRYTAGPDGKYFVDDLTEHDIRRAKKLISDGIDIDYHDGTLEKFRLDAENDILPIISGESESCNYEIYPTGKNSMYMKLSLYTSNKLLSNDEKSIGAFGLIVANALHECMSMSPFYSQNAESKLKSSLSCHREYQAKSDKIEIFFDINFDDLEIFIDVYFPSLNRILKSDIEISREIGRCLDRAFLLPSN